MELNCNFQVRALSKRKLNKVCFGIAIFLFSLKAVGLKAQQVQPGSSTLTSESVETNIPGVMAYRATPKAFDAETASELELARYGLPPRPNPEKSAQAYEVWKDLVRASHERVIPELTESNIYHGSIKNFSPGSKKLATGSMPGSSSNWSGFVITDPNNAFSQAGVVAAYYTVPGVDPCLKLGPRLWSSNWVGIDGFTYNGVGSGDVFQVGTSSDADCTQGANNHQLYYAWVEWYPNTALIANQQVPILPGDSMFICASTVYGRYVVTVRNKTRGKSYSLPMSPPAGTHLVGNSIEWIIERPQVNGSQTDLAFYTRSAWQTMLGYYQTGALQYRPSLTPTGTSYTLTMFNQAGVAISTPTLYPGPVDDAAWFNGIEVW